MNRLITLSFCILLASCSTELDSNPKLTGSDHDIFQSVIDSIYKANPESIGLMAHIESPSNGVSWSGSAGYSDINKTTKLSEYQPALIASNIKTYVAASILRLQEEGKLNIEDPIARHLSEKTANLFRSDGYKIDKIKIKHLLSHTSGIEDYVNTEYFELINKNPKYRWTRNKQLARAVSQGDPLGEPQEQFKYADANYLLATEIIEQKTQKPFYTAMRELLKYDQLKLTHTWFPTLDQPADKNTENLVHQYWNENQWGESKMDISWDSYDHDISWDLYGGGGIATNMEELAKFSFNLFNGNIIQDLEVLNLIKTDVTTSNGIQKIYRLGVADATIKGLQSLGHGGFWGTQVFHIPQLDASISVCVLERKGKMKIIESSLNTLTSELTKQVTSVKHVVQNNYELYKVKDSKATLILYPGGGANAEQTKQEFDIITAATANQISVLLMNVSGHLWLDHSTASQLSTELESIFSENNLKTENVHIGGMSIGGNVALSLTNYLHENPLNIIPKSAFIVDSPIDLYALYESAQKDVKNTDFDEERLAEPKWIINNFKNAFSEDSLLNNLQKVSPFTVISEHTSVPYLERCKLRFYTEPDKLWWKENRQTDFENTNAYSIQQIALGLKAKGWKQFELVETENKGYRANGQRHPHSWSIIDTRELIDWMKR